MSQRPANADFNYANMDWDQYMAHRPAYPAQLYEMIWDYHQAHGGNFDNALDVGGGVGVVTRDLLPKFSHVTLSDLSDLYISQAKNAFASTTNPKQLSFLTRKIEDITPEDLPNGPVDLITAGTCLHWADIEKVTPTAARLIRSGGTFSAWMYGGQPVFPESHRAAHEILGRIFDRLLDYYTAKISELTDTGPSANMHARFDNMAFNPEQWKNVRRIKVMPDKPMMDARISKVHSRVLPEIEQQEVLRDDFIGRKADYAWVEGYIHSMIPPLDIKEYLKEELKVLKNAMGDAELELYWPFAFVLATRR